MTIKRILVPVDFSKASLAGLDYAIRLARQFNAAVAVLFVIEPLYYAGDLGLFLEEQQRFGREQLSRLAVRLKKRRLKCRTSVQTGVPYQVIADEAERWHADLIVLATHGRSGFSRLAMGSVAAKVVRTAGCPVLTVRPVEK
jgi:nucleotide-binding universal stress UspA family protein